MREKIVLVIDDDDMNLQIAKMVLEKKLKCKVLTVDNGRDGLEILRQEKVSLVLLDILMPEFDGIETLTEIRADENLKDMAVMMLTAMSGIENLKKVYALGVKDYIKKPFMPADLVSRVEKKFAELEPEEKILLFGTNGVELRAMQQIIEENFDCETEIAKTELDAKKIFDANKITLIIADAQMKFIDGLKILEFVAANKNLDKVPFALTTSEKLSEFLEKLKPPEVKKVEDSVLINAEKNKLAKVVTSLIGYELDVHI